ncbi:MAG: alanine--tRNA ligase [Nitrospirota bacterium]
MTSADLREAFLAFFESKGHARVPSGSLIPRQDPTLFFTNAGMVPFKAVFLGEESRPYARAASCQKCIRAGGKHNDLENVGRTLRHHTFFEMLGNFSFGDYFKREAIAFAWEFLTRVVNLPVERLWVTIYEKDDEAERLWRELTPIPAGRIMRFGEKDNFWSMGETGPCGPCSEIHYDQGPDVPGDDVPNGEGDRIMEIWNLVFMQFNRDGKGILTPLPKPSIDTGMGLERLASVVQGVHGNYETDIFRPFLAAIEERAGVGYGTDPAKDVSLRVIADHVRATAFLLSEGLLPANEGRGFVLRRILRRAARHGRLLGIEGPFLGSLMSVVVDEMGSVYPELVEGHRHAARVAELEEERFAHALDTGLRLLDEVVEKVRAGGGTVIPGADLFKLYDTFGFPLDIAQDVANERGLSVDEAGFREAMEGQRQRARASWAGSGEEAVAPVYKELAVHPATQFVGYQETEAALAVILAIVKNGESVQEARPGEEIEVLLDRTPFYAESGGQTGDRGTLLTERGRVDVADTQKRAGARFFHKGSVHHGTIRVGDRVTKAVVDREARLAAARNHTATHLLHAVLREVLGDHVKQSGSLVSSDRLRFDFTHFAAISPHEIERIEERVNAHVLENIPLDTEEKGLDEAVASGAMALFGEKYGDRVRVVRIGEASTELCGGTHSRSTGDIGLFKVVREESVGAGTRRIEAVTGEGALSHVRGVERVLRDSAAVLKIKDLSITPRIERLLEEKRDLERELSRFKEKAAASQAGDLMADVREVDGVRLIVRRVDGVLAKDLRDLGDGLRDRVRSGVIVLGGEAEGKVVLLAVVTKDLTSRFHAGEILKAVAEKVGGKGGGRPDMAQAGGKDPSKIDEALSLVEDLIRLPAASSGSAAQAGQPAAR